MTATGSLVPSLDRLRGAARDRARRLVTAGLRRVPDSAFAPLRASFLSSEPTSVRHHLQQAILKAARYRGVPTELDSFVLPDNPSVRLVNADSFLVEWLYWFGERYGYEPGTITWWKRFSASSSHILELGANVGYYVVQGARAGPQAHYVGVEPHPGCAAVCRRNIELNGLTNAEVVEAAAVPSPDSPSVELVLPGGRDHYTQAPATGFVGVNDVHHAAEDRTTYTSVTVPSIPVNDLLVDAVDLVKMDVEGQEHSLLSAALPRLLDLRPTLFVEVLETTPKLRSLILDRLLPAGYRCFVPTPDALVPLSADDLASVWIYKEYGTRDVVLTCLDAVPSAP